LPKFLFDAAKRKRRLGDVPAPDFEKLTDTIRIGRRDGVWFHAMPEPASLWRVLDAGALVAVSGMWTEPREPPAEAATPPGGDLFTVPIGADWGRRLTLVRRGSPGRAVFTVASEMEDSRLRPQSPLPPDAGRLLYVLARCRTSRLALDVGTGVGAAALWLGAGVAGRVVSLEQDSARATAARKRLRRAGVRVEVGIGDAARLIPESGTPDLVFLDGEATRRQEHLELALRAAGPGALIMSRLGPALELAAAHALLRTHPRVVASALIDAGGGLLAALLRK
jgi:precorrin-6B methylase 2